MGKEEVVQSEIGLFQACLCNPSVTKKTRFMLLDYVWYIAGFYF